MFDYINIMKDMLSEDETRQLQAIYEPRVVAVPPFDARRDMCVMKDGEIRHYGLADRKKHGDEGNVVYLSSCDCGLTWKKKYSVSNQVMGAAVFLPWCNHYVTIKPVRFGEHPGTYAYISAMGPEDEHPFEIKIADVVYWDIFQPVFFEGSNRIFVTTSTTYTEDGKERNHPVVLYSDNNGYNWNVVNLQGTPEHSAKWPDQGVRWQNTGTEPSMTKLSDGTLMLVARTSLDYMYAYYSKDNGNSWTTGKPSKFHCTLTTPYIYRLFDGRNILFWNNGQPLPEMRTEAYTPTVPKGCASVFTNRDAAHCAISQDGVNWSGFREILLNTTRNYADYRTLCGAGSGADRSVQQFQAIELPFHKMLVSLGQNEACRRMLIFDLDWLYEMKRTEDFKCGLDHVSTFTYVKSLSGCQIWQGLNGHCHWNRTNGALLMPMPGEDIGEALFLCTTSDPRLYSNVQGCVWNFPMSKRGKIRIKLRVEGEGIQISLADRWFNPVDTTIDKMAQFSVPLTAREIKRGEWTEVTVNYDLDKNSMDLYHGNGCITRALLLNHTTTGISYLHIHTLGEKEDFKGTYIAYMSQEGDTEK